MTQIVPQVLADELLIIQNDEANTLEFVPEQETFLRRMSSKMVSSYKRWMAKRRLKPKKNVRFDLAGKVPQFNNK